MRPVFSDITDGKFNEMLPDDFLKSLPEMDDCIAVAIYQTRKYYGVSGENNGRFTTEAIKATHALGLHDFELVV